jgi:hypothetical protein
MIVWRKLAAALYLLEVIDMLTGGCLCGDTRYETGGTPFHETNCHCSMCRRASGAPMVAWFSVMRSQLRWLRGAPTRYRSSAQATRSFCPRCGTQLTFESDQYPDEIDLTTCSLDNPELVPPQDQTRVSSRLSWVKLDDGLPQHLEARPDS